MIVVPHRPLRFPVSLLALQGLALVVVMLTFADADFKLGPAILEIELGGDQGESPLLDPLGNLADFVTIKQQLA